MTNKRTKLARLAISFVFTLFLFSSIPNLSAFPAFTQEGENEYLPAAEEMPTPVGGLKALYSKITYPEIARQSGIEGKVYVIAFVNENGEVDDVKILKGIGGGCDEAAIKAVKATRFTPGKAKGHPVKVKVALPIIFKLKH